MANPRIPSLFAAILLAMAAPSAARAQAADYRVLVAAGTDSIRVIAFDGRNARVERSFGVGVLPDTAEGIHSLAVSPDGRTLFATLGNGQPTGRILRIDPATGRTAGVAELASGVSSMAVSPDGSLVYVTMSDPRATMGRGSLWVVSTGDLKPVASVTTCIHPAGGRLTQAGRHYSACAMEDQVIELDVEQRRVNRRFSVAEEEEGAVDTLAAAPDGPFMEGRVLPPTCSPTAAEPSPDGRSLWVACNRNASVVEVDAESWTLVRRLEAGHGPYLLSVTPDGRTLLVLLRQGHALRLFDTADGTPRSRVELAVAPEGLVVSRDGRYAFITTEGEGGTAGTLDIVDLGAARRLASVPLGQHVGALALWQQPR